MYKVIDLFAGAGGLSLGFKQTEKYTITAAFEINKNAQETYKKNHQIDRMYSDVCTANFKALNDELGGIDVVIGGPPCQGFSNANRQRNHAVSQNNMLVKQFVRAVCEIKPTAFVMENVGMLRSDVHRFYLRKDEVKLIKKYGIALTESEIPLLEQKFYSNEIASLVEDEEKVKSLLWAESDYKLLNVVYRQRNNLKKCKAALNRHKKQLTALAEKITKSDHYKGEFACFVEAAEAVLSFFSDNMKEKQVIEKIEKAIMLQRCLGNAKELYDNELKIERYNRENGISAVVSSFSVLDYIEGVLGSKDYGYTFDKGILNAAEFGVPQRRNRFVLIGIKKSKANKIQIPTGSYTKEDFRTVKDAIKDLQNVETLFETKNDKGTPLSVKTIPQNPLLHLRDSKKIYNHIITKTTDNAMRRFKALKQGENFHSLDSSLKKDTYTDPSRTQNTIYQRLNYNEPSGTVLNVRKSMWIHPELDRAISVREAARLQTFPDSFVFCGTKDSQYQQVGNAVPPLLAEAIANHLAEYLDGDDNGG